MATESGQYHTVRIHRLSSFKLKYKRPDENPFHHDRADEELAKKIVATIKEKRAGNLRQRLGREEPGLMKNQIEVTLRKVEPAMGNDGSEWVRVNMDFIQESTGGKAILVPYTVDLRT